MFSISPLPHLLLLLAGDKAADLLQPPLRFYASVRDTHTHTHTEREREVHRDTKEGWRIRGLEMCVHSPVCLNAKTEVDRERVSVCVYVCLFHSTHLLVPADEIPRAHGADSLADKTTRGEPTRVCVVSYVTTSTWPQQSNSLGGPNLI